MNPPNKTSASSLDSYNFEDLDGPISLPGPVEIRYVTANGKVVIEGTSPESGAYANRKDNTLTIKLDGEKSHTVSIRPGSKVTITNIAEDFRP